MTDLSVLSKPAADCLRRPIGQAVLDRIQHLPLSTFKTRILGWMCLALEANIEKSPLAERGIEILTMDLHTNEQVNHWNHLRRIHCVDRDQIEGFYMVAGLVAGVALSLLTTLVIYKMFDHLYKIFAEHMRW